MKAYAEAHELDLQSFYLWKGHVRRYRAYALMSFFK